MQARVDQAEEITHPQQVSWRDSRRLVLKAGIWRDPSDPLFIEQKVVPNQYYAFCTDGVKVFRAVVNGDQGFEAFVAALGVSVERVAAPPDLHVGPTPCDVVIRPIPCQASIQAAFDAQLALSIAA